MLLRKYVSYFITLAFIITTGCNSSQYDRYRDSRFSMGSFLEIILFSNDKALAKKVIDESYKLADDLESKISAQKETSIVSAINKTKEFKINNESDKVIEELIRESIEYSKLTDGAFDPAIFNITKLWGFSSIDGPFIPEKNQIEDGLKKSGYKNIIIQKDKVKLLNDVSFDFGGIAQGKIIGEIAKYLISNNIKDFLINASGDIYIKGKFKGERLWRIAIANPFDKNKYLGFINLSDVCIITSGDYEKFVTDKNGINYHHILDPKTGYSAINNVHSVTVINKDPAKTDALATAIFVMGEKKGIEFANSTNDVDVIIISGDRSNYKISTSKNITFNKIENDMYEFNYNPIK